MEKEAGPSGGTIEDGLLLLVAQQLSQELKIPVYDAEILVEHAVAYEQYQRMPRADSYRNLGQGRVISSLQKRVKSFGLRAPAEAKLRERWRQLKEDKRLVPVPGASPLQGAVEAGGSNPPFMPGQHEQGAYSRLRAKMAEGIGTSEGGLILDRLRGQIALLGESVGRLEAEAQEAKEALDAALEELRSLRKTSSKGMGEIQSAASSIDTSSRRVNEAAVRVQGTTRRLEESFKTTQGVPSLHLSTVIGVQAAVTVLLVSLVFLVTAVRGEPSSNLATARFAGGLLALLAVLAPVGVLVSLRAGVSTWLGMSLVGVAAALAGSLGIIWGFVLWAFQTHLGAYIGYGWTGGPFWTGAALGIAASAWYALHTSGVRSFRSAIGVFAGFFVVSLVSANLGLFIFGPPTPSDSMLAWALHWMRSWALGATASGIILVVTACLLWPQVLKEWVRVLPSGSSVPD